MGRHGCDADEAFGRLVKLSNDTNVRVVEVARALVYAASGAWVPATGTPGNRRRKAGFGAVLGGRRRSFPGRAGLPAPHPGGCGAGARRVTRSGPCGRANRATKSTSKPEVFPDGACRDIPDARPLSPLRARPPTPAPPGGRRPPASSRRPTGPTPRPARAALPGGGHPAQHAGRRRDRPPLPRPGDPRRRHRPGRQPRPGQGRPRVRPHAGLGLPQLRGPHHPRRDPALLPRLRLDHPPAPLGPGAAVPDHRRGGRAVPVPGPLPTAQRGRRAPRRRPGAGPGLARAPTAASPRSPWTPRWPRARAVPATGSAAPTRLRQRRGAGRAAAA